MKLLAIIGLLTASLALTATSALAKDRYHGQDKHRENFSARQHSSDSSLDKHDNRRDSRRYSSSHRAGHNYGHNYAHKHYHDNNYRHHYRGYPRYYYRHDRYIEDYFTILGGTILINELLHHSHDYH
jgi:Ni/Co efflux regulator RcnB